MFSKFASFVALAVLAAPALAIEPKAPTEEVKKDKTEKKICKRTVDTGSLIKGRKICRTVRDWQTSEDAKPSMEASGATQNQ